MTDAIRQRLLDLKAAQDADQPMPCPRCGADAMKHPITTNALSRHADLYICDSCGTAEALLAFMGQIYPLHQWNAFEPQRPPADFRSKPASAVLAEVIQKQVDTLTRLYRLCRADPDNAVWHRLAAFECCAGLTELWTDPFRAKYTCQDGSVLVQYCTAASGQILMSAGIIEK